MADWRLFDPQKLAAVVLAPPEQPHEAPISGVIHTNKQPFRENRVQIGAFVRLKFCSQEIRTH